MAAIDVERLLKEISPEAPFGDNLEYDAAFREMEQAAQGKPEQQMGDTLIPAEEPDWKTVKEKALDVLGRSRDLRAAMHLARALGESGGLPALAEGLALVRGMHERCWDGFHPQLDPDDGNDPTTRLNVLMILCSSDHFLKTVRCTPIASSRGLGRIGLREIQWSTGAMPPPASVTAQTPAAIDAIFSDCEIDELRANEAGAAACIEHATAVEAFLTEKLGAAGAVSLEAFTDLVKEVRTILADRLSRRGIVTAGAAEASGAAAGGTAPAGAAVSVPGSISSREDAMKMLDRISEWFARNEPSSPVPLLLQRAKRLVSKTFLEILKDMAPDGLGQAEKIGGVEPQA